MAPTKAKVSPRALQQHGSALTAGKSAAVQSGTVQKCEVRPPSNMVQKGAGKPTCL
eukprot:CAMPEP_0171101126 /NCGR_PEP_ID=MMETSP0766_2-20121228/54101_1 /TAXON_ID=439317 /ORGANISM="Gambierdiscus australes, Strain CAWD 149" /LENGTH=55 /DNA_ID=CAMNT_0011561093 /DNA_START=99 /DNA_END=263 /DNA_ORIENTATION=+